MRLREAPVRTTRRIVTVTFLLTLVVALVPGAPVPGASAADAPPVAPASQGGPHVVVAVIDSGVNVYHEFFRAPALVDHPSTWLPGFPEDAGTVNLTFDASSVGAAVDADAHEWARVERSGSVGGAHVYSFPGTRVVAGVSFGEWGQAQPDDVPIMDEIGHGTASAGLAAGFDLAAADANVLIVAVEVPQGGAIEGIRWAAEQPWIDALTISLGNVANAPLWPNVFGWNDVGEATRAAAVTHGKPVFIASGNGFTGTGFAPDGCSTYTSPFTGPWWVTRIGAADPVTENPTWWHCYPVEAIARTDVPSTGSWSYTSTPVATGTSAATPNAAGHWAHLALEARRAGAATAEDNRALLDHLLHASLPARPALLAVGTVPGLHGASYHWQGWGLVDEDAVDRALATWLAGNGPFEREVGVEEWFAADHAIRVNAWGR